MNREKLIAIVEKGKIFVKSTKSKVIITGVAGAIIGFNLGGATSEQLNAVEELPKIRVELQGVQAKNEELTGEVDELKKVNKDLDKKVKEAEPFFKEKEKKELEATKRKEAEEEKKAKIENDKKVAKQKETNKEIRDTMFQLMQENYKNVSKIGVKEEGGVVFFTITTQGFADAALLFGKEHPDYVHVKETLEDLSKILVETASDGGSNEKFGIAVLNDKNIENVLLMFMDGVCTYEFD